MMLAGVVFFGILIGSLGEIVQHASTRARQAQMFRRKFEDVEAWMRMRRLPKHTQKRIRWATKAHSQTDQGSCQKQIKKWIR